MLILQWIQFELSQRDSAAAQPVTRKPWNLMGLSSSSHVHQRRTQAVGTRKTYASSHGCCFASQVAVCGAVGLLSKGFMQLLNTTEAAGREHLLQAMSRPDSQGLVTVSNHTAALDDPLVLSALMPLESMPRPADFRWGTCATDRCFKGPLMAAFFRAGKVSQLSNQLSPTIASRLLQGMPCCWNHSQNTKSVLRVCCCQKEQPHEVMPRIPSSLTCM